MSCLYLPSKDTAILLVPHCADQELRTFPSRQMLDEGQILDAPPEGARVMAVLRDPLDRWTEFHRTHWLENRTTSLPEELRKVGFQRDWAPAQVASHCAALASAVRDAPKLVPVGPYSPQTAYWGSHEPETLLYEHLALEWDRKLGDELPPLELQRVRYKFAPVAVVGELKSQLESAYAADAALHAQAMQKASSDYDRLRRIVAR